MLCGWLYSAVAVSWDAAIYGLYSPWEMLLGNSVGAILCTAAGALLVLLVLAGVLLWPLRTPVTCVAAIIRAPFRVPVLGSILGCVVRYLLITGLVALLAVWIGASVWVLMMLWWIVVAILKLVARLLLRCGRGTCRVAVVGLPIWWVRLAYGGVDTETLRYAVRDSSFTMLPYWTWVLAARRADEQARDVAMSAKVSSYEMLLYVRGWFDVAPDVPQQPVPAPPPPAAPAPRQRGNAVQVAQPNGVPAVALPAAPPVVPVMIVVPDVRMRDVFDKYIGPNIGALHTCSKGAASVKLLKLVSVMPQTNDNERAVYQATVNLIWRLVDRGTVFAPEGFR